MVLEKEMREGKDFWNFVKNMASVSQTHSLNVRQEENIPGTGLEMFAETKLTLLWPKTDFETASNNVKPTLEQI